MTGFWCPGSGWKLIQTVNNVLSRLVSDHCALVLKNMTVDWGPKPFKSLDVWQSDGRFLDFVHNKCRSYEVQGRGLFILKEKLKKVKTRSKNLE